MNTILIVDDDADVRSLLQTSFQLDGGWSVIMADSVASAVHELDTAAIDVVLTDNQLGDGGASDVLARSAGRPVIMLSASVDAPPSTVMPLPGFAGGIAKPFNPLTLPGLVTVVVNNSEG